MQTMQSTVWGRGQSFGLLAGLVVGFLAMGRGAAAAPEPRCPGGSSPDPNVIMCDDFEDGMWLDTWDSSPYCCDTNKDGTISFAEREAVTSGGYNSAYAAWTDFDSAQDLLPDPGWVYSGHYGTHGVPAFNEAYMRWYVYTSPGYEWGDNGDKTFRITAYDASGNVRVTDVIFELQLWGTGQPAFLNTGQRACVIQSYHQNVGNDITIQPGTWYLIEWYVKMNTPGQANGISRVWIDEAATVTPGTQTLRWNYNNICFNDSSVTQLPDSVFLSAYSHAHPTATHYQYQKWDQLVVSRAPIGPMGSTPPCPLRGDLDCSGKVDLDDLRRMIYMLIGTVPKDLTKADLDGDGQLLLVDLQALVRILVGLP